jgi:hypothetical protein
MRIELMFNYISEHCSFAPEFEVDSTVRRNFCTSSWSTFDRDCRDLEGVMATLAEQPIYHLYI